MSIPMIYRKDLLTVLQSMAFLPALLVAVYIFHDFIGPTLYHMETTPDSLAAVCIMAILCMSGLLAAMAGARVSAEEKNSGTDVFLARFPISVRRLQAEKIGAGLTALTLLYSLGVAIIYGFGFDQLYPTKPQDVGSIASNFAIIVYTTYIAAIVASRYFASPLGVVMAAITLECIGWGIAAVAVGPARGEFWLAVGSILAILAVFGMPFFLAGVRWQLPWTTPRWGRSNWQQFKGMATKSFTDCGLLNAMCMSLLIVAIWLQFSPQTAASIASIHPAYAPRLLIPLLSIFFVSGLGALCYGTTERDSRRCLLYNHPVPRAQIFWAKHVAALPALIAAYVALIITRDDLPAASVAVVAVLLYMLTVQLALVLHRGTVIVLLGGMTGVACAIGPIALWIMPTEFYLLFPGVESDLDPKLIASVPLTFVTLSVIVSTYYMATNRLFLAGSENYRQQVFLKVIIATAAFTGMMTGLYQHTVGF